MSDVEQFRDDNRCGLKNWRTAKWDPYRLRACKPHDEEFQDKLDGTPTDSLLEVNGKWVLNTVTTALIGAYAVGTLPLYLLGGLLGGTARWWWID